MAANPSVESYQPPYARSLAEIPQQSTPSSVELASVKYKVPLGSQSHAQGFVEIYGYVMQDGNFYEVHHGEPSDRKTDVPFWIYPALGTGNEGHNKVAQLNVMSQGIPTASVGPRNATTRTEGLPHLPKQPEKTNLCGVAHAAHAIMKEAATANFYEEDEMMVGGESQGGMWTLAIKGIERWYGHRVRYGQAKAPVLPDKLRKEDYPALSWQWGIVEPIALVRNLRRLPRGDLIRHAKTLASGKAYKESRKQFMPALTNGEVGEAAQMIDTNADIDITVFSQDHMSRPHMWRNILPLAQYPGIRIDLLEGSHLSVISKGIGSRHSLEQIEAARDRLGI